mmetsp:Transcript_104451/g.277925  ORF Transcript_104451/g.277925 Transcript_104451/m.277925 type:complete len:229 (-) Transcript_104451:1845-2531(-)
MEDGGDLPREGAAGQGDHPEPQGRDLQAGPTGRAGRGPEHQPGEHGQPAGPGEERPHQAPRHAAGAGAAAELHERRPHLQGAEAGGGAPVREQRAPEPAGPAAAPRGRGRQAPEAQGDPRQGPQGPAAEHGAAAERDQLQEGGDQPQQRGHLPPREAAQGGDPGDRAPEGLPRAPRQPQGVAEEVAPGRARGPREALEGEHGPARPAAGQAERHQRAGRVQGEAPEAV